MFERAVTIALALTLLSTSAIGQSLGKIAGTVTGNGSNEPLPGATVVIQELGLGSESDASGTYAIIGVPAGSYQVKASYVGFESVIVQGVVISSGLTRELDFKLDQDVADLDEVVVEYQRPLIQRDAIGASKVVTAFEIQNLPVRGVSAVAALQAGVVAGNGREELHIRGGRSQETVYFVDGVKVIGYTAVPQQAILEQEMLIGSLPAKYGDAMSGIVSISTKSGGSTHFGTVEAVSSGVTDSHGYQLVGASVGGPILTDKLSFFAAGEYLYDDDPFPSAIQVPLLPEDRVEFLQQYPQSLRFRNADGNPVYLPFPADLAPSVDSDGDGRADAMTYADVISAVSPPDGLVLDSPFPLSAAEVEPLSSYEFTDGLPNRERELFRASANLTLRPARSIYLKAGGRYEQFRRAQLEIRNSLFNPDRFQELTGETVGFGVTATHHLSSSTFYQLHVDWSEYAAKSYDPAVSSRIEELLFYGDIDHPANAAVPRYRLWDARDSLYVGRYEDGDFPSRGGVYNLYRGPGVADLSFEKENDRQLRLTANAATQLGMHQIEFGGEYESRTERYFGMGGNSLARLYDDGRVEGGDENAISDYSQVPFTVANRQGLSYWGYDYLGLEEVNEQDIDGFVEGANGACNDIESGPDPACNVAPYKPMYFAGYVQDKFEYKDLVMNLGLRVDVFDNNTFVLKDRYALVPLVRAGDLDERPPNIGDDFAVYFDGRNEVFGFRDLDGNFYDSQGLEADGPYINLRGAPEVPESAQPYLTSAVFEDYTPSITWLPRLGLSFSITDLALFFAHIDRTSQRPFEVPFDGLHSYWRASRQFTFLANNGLRPATTTEYEVGLRHRLGPRAAFTISGFYKKVSGLIRLERLQLAYPTSYVTWTNDDFGTIKGMEAEFDLRRTKHLSLNANYTLQFAFGTGSHAGTARNRSWQPAPLFLAPLDFEQRHTLTANIDYRLGAGEGPAIAGLRPFENAAVNLVLNLNSGRPYSRVSLPPHPQPLGQPNSETMPWWSLINVRLEKRFDLDDLFRMTPYVWIQNLLDTDNVRWVYPTTGLPYENGYRSTGVADDFFARQEIPEAARELYGWAWNDPDYYGIPRLVRLGVRLDF